MDDEQRVLKLNRHHFKRDASRVETEIDDEVLVSRLCRVER